MLEIATGLPCWHIVSSCLGDDSCVALCCACQAGFWWLPFPRPCLAILPSCRTVNSAALEALGIIWFLPVLSLTLLMSKERKGIKGILRKRVALTRWQWVRVLNVSLIRWESPLHSPAVTGVFSVEQNSVSRRASHLVSVHVTVLWFGKKYFL